MENWKITTNGKINTFSSFTQNVTSTGSPECVYCKNSSAGSTHSWVCNAVSVLSDRKQARRTGHRGRLDMEKTRDETRSAEPPIFCSFYVICRQLTFQGINITAELNNLPANHIPGIGRRRRGIHGDNCNILQRRLEIRKQTRKVPRSHNEATRIPLPVD